MRINSISCMAILLATTLISCKASYVVKERPAEVVYVRPAPPPGPHVWVSGDWVWTGGSYRWHEGHWEGGHHGRAWVDGHWKSTRGGWQWAPGHWR